MKMKSVQFKGQLSGQVAKEKYFENLRKEHKITLPSIGKVSENKLPASKLDGAMLSILDGPRSLTVDGQPVAKTKVYSGETKIPVNFTLTFKINRVSDTSCKLSADIQSK